MEEWMIWQAGAFAFLFSMNCLYIKITSGRLEVIETKLTSMGFDVGRLQREWMTDSYEYPKGTFVKRESKAGKIRKSLDLLEASIDEYHDQMLDRTALLAEDSKKNFKVIPETPARTILA